ncbi:MAG: SUF system NifU family Fe-S cluster assembly protein [Candidatus Magasanikbacteria bacterium]|nr:SUF system NifU family Fe-S cluster assembly protein [Candidatus Magasanikbacteria bacterium]
MDLYSENILDHYQNPHNSGEITDRTIRVFENNPLCGDTIQMDLKIKNDTIIDIAFIGSGCAISQSSMSMLSDEIKGKKLSVLKKMKTDKVYKLLQVPISLGRVKCALLGYATLQHAIKDFEK